MDISSRFAAGGTRSTVLDLLKLGKGLNEGRVLPPELMELMFTPMTTREGTSTGDEILDLVRDVEADLVVLGATLRRLDDRPFLGHKVETVLQNCDATVVVVTVPLEL